MSQLQPLNLKKSLDLAMAKVGRHAWKFPLLRLDRWRRNGFPDRLYRIFKDRVDPERPFFIGETADGTRYVGDFRDFYPVMIHVQKPDHHGPFTRLLQSRMPATGAFVDVGANTGAVAAIMARALPGRGVFAFEPLPETALRAAATCALNGLWHVKVFAAAVSDRDGEISLFHEPGISDVASMHLLPNTPKERWQRVTVPSVRLDTLAEAGTLGDVAMIKFDVEGHEPQAVAGSQRLIARHRPKVIYEYSYHHAPKIGWKAQDVAAEISAAGGEYRFQVLEDDGSLTPYPPPDRTGGNVSILCEPAGEPSGAARGIA